MPIDRLVPDDVELTTLLDELRKLSWAAADVLIAYARGQEPPYGFPKYLTVEEGGDGPVSAADTGPSPPSSTVKVFWNPYGGSSPRA